MTDIDDAARAARLEKFANELSKLNEDCFAEAGIDMDVPDVPRRFACAQYDGSGAWIAFADELDDARKIQQDAPHEEVPWGPGDVLDLDTGQRYSTVLTATLERYTHRVTWTSVIGDSTWAVEGWYKSEEIAEGIAAEMRLQGSVRDVTVDVVDVTVEPAP